MNIGKMMQQAKKMQEKVQKVQEEIAALEVAGEAGGGMVKVQLAGDRMVKRVEIDPSLWAEQDKELTEDLVAAAFNAASHALEEKMKEHQQQVLAGMPLPPGFSL